MNQSDQSSLESVARRTALTLDRIAHWLEPDAQDIGDKAIRQWALDARRELLDALDAQETRERTAITHALELGANVIAEDW